MSISLFLLVVEISCSSRHQICSQIWKHRAAADLSSNAVTVHLGVITTPEMSSFTRHHSFGTSPLFCSLFFVLSYLSRPSKGMVSTMRTHVGHCCVNNSPTADVQVPLEHSVHFFSVSRGVTVESLAESFVEWMVDGGALAVPGTVFRVQTSLVAPLGVSVHFHEQECKMPTLHPRKVQCFLLCMTFRSS